MLPFSQDDKKEAMIRKNGMSIFIKGAVWLV
jgi:hypothetical protein